MNEAQLVADFMQWAQQEGLAGRPEPELWDMTRAYLAGYAAASADAEDKAGRPLN